MRKYLSFASAARTLVLLAVLLAGSIPNPVAAYDISFFQSNDILWYNPNGGGAACDAGKSYSTKLDIPGLTGNDNAEKIWNFLITEGLSEEQAAGLMGNIYQEAGFNPDLEEGNGIGYGIVQWSFGRRTALEDKAKELSVDVSDLSFQLSYMVDEAKNPPLVDFNGLFAKYDANSSDNVWDLLKEQETIEDATIVFHDGFERSGDYDNHGGIQHRIDYAKEVFEKFSGTSAAGARAAGGASCPPAAGSGDLAAMTLEYAWPEWKGSGFVDPMPAYQAVIDKGPEYRDMGGSVYRGIDCVGFVTTLLIDSGFDPEFNFAGQYYGKGSGKGADIERAWLEDSGNGWEMIASEGKKTDGGGILASSDLQPGDVAVTPLRHQVTDGGSIPGHTFVFVGQIDGFDSQYASASMDDRAPMATSGDYESAANTKFEWWRKVR